MHHLVNGQMIENPLYWPVFWSTWIKHAQSFFAKFFVARSIIYLLGLARKPKTPVTLDINRIVNKDLLSTTGTNLDPESDRFGYYYNWNFDNINLWLTYYDEMIKTIIQ